MLNGLLPVCVGIISGHHTRHERFTGEPDSAASEASSGAHHLASLASADMVGLVNHVGRPVEILKQKKKDSTGETYTIVTENRGNSYYFTSAAHTSKLIFVSPVWLHV